MPDAACEHVVELIPAYALNCLDPGEAEVVARHLDGCEDCRAEAAAYMAVVDLLPLAAPEIEPSPALKERLMARVESSPSPAPPVAAPPAVAPPAAAEPATRPSWRHSTIESIRNWLSGPRWQPAALLVIALLVVSNILLWRQLNQPRGSSTGWQRVALSETEVAPGAVGIIYISRDGRAGTLIVDGLPQLNPEQQYQLWLIRDGQRASGGVFSVDEGGYSSLAVDSPQPLGDYNAFGVTVEPAGGSPGPTGERVLGYNL